MTLEDRFLEFIDAHDWRVARTAQKTHPHSYLVRDKSRSDMEFLWAVEYIREYGYDIKWRDSRYYRYLDVAGYHYWTMGFHRDITIILNRAMFPLGHVQVPNKKNPFPMRIRKTPPGAEKNLKCRGLLP